MLSTLLMSRTSRGPLSPLIFLSSKTFSRASIWGGILVSIPSCPSTPAALVALVVGASMALLVLPLSFVIGFNLLVLGGPSIDGDLAAIRESFFMAARISGLVASALPWSVLCCSTLWRGPAVGMGVCALSGKWLSCCSSLLPVWVCLVSPFSSLLGCSPVSPWVVLYPCSFNPSRYLLVGGFLEGVSNVPKNCFSSYRLLCTWKGIAWLKKNSMKLFAHLFLQTCAPILKPQPQHLDSISSWSRKAHSF